MSAPKWQFSARFRRHAFGWRSDTPIKRIKEALSEIRAIARKEPILAAEGAVLFLEKISPALEHVDSSSGAIGNAVNHAIEALVSIISQAVVPEKIRQQWLTRLWEALQEDQMPYIETLGDYWGGLCVTPELASIWVEEFIDLVKHIWSPKVTGFNYFKGTIPCLSALYAAKHYQELLTLLESSPYKSWHNQRWGIKALLALGQPEEALKYARENAKELNAPIMQIARECESILISMGRHEEAYKSYSLMANQTTTNLATFRAICKKYPSKASIDILQDLIDSQPGAEGKWFAAAKDAGFYDLAIELISKYPADPRTLTRAAKDFSEKNSSFAMAAGLASLRWMIEGYGYEITGVDVLAAYFATVQAAKNANITSLEIHDKIRALLLIEKSNNKIKDILKPYLHE